MDAGALLYAAIYVCQQLGVMLGVGAQTVLLCAHLVALHRHEAEDTRGSFMRAARGAQAAGLALMLVSGVVAVAIHSFSGATGTLLAPAFVFKWALIALVMALFLLMHRAERGHVLMGIAGGSWYALFLVHSLGPVTTWASLLVVYVIWMAFFGIMWALFVAVMSRPSAPKVAAAMPATPPPAPAAPPRAPAPKPMPPPAPKVVAPPPLPPKPVAPPPPPPVPKLVPPPPPPPVPTPLPVVAKPAPVPIVIKTAPAPLNLPKLPDMLEHDAPLVPKQIPGTGAPKPRPDLPGLHVMPQKPEDVGQHLRDAVARPA